MPSAWADELVLDIDSDEDLKLAMAATFEIVKHLTSEWEVPTEAISIHFSGAKGFHIGIRLGHDGTLRPSRRIHEELEALRDRLRRELSLGPLLDPCLRGPKQGIRIPNTRNLRSGLYKIPLSFFDIGLAPADAIREMALTPREVEESNGVWSPDIIGASPDPPRVHGTLTTKPTIEEIHVGRPPRRQSDLDKFIGQIRDRVSLIELLEEVFEDRVQPIRETHNHWSLPCPFHEEGSRPNGVVFKGPLQFYQCYSSKCGVWGDVVEIHRRIHDASFRSSLEALAKLAGLLVPEDLLRGIEKDKQLHNQLTIRSLRPGSELGKLFRQVSGLYADLLVADVSYCADPAIGFVGDDPCFFYSVSRYQKARGGDYKTLLPQLNRMVVVGVVRNGPEELSEETDRTRRAAGARKPYQRRSRHFIVPRLTDELVQIAERKATCIAPLGSTMKGTERDRLLACGDDYDLLQAKRDRILAERGNEPSRLRQELDAMFTDDGILLEWDELQALLQAKGFSARFLRVNLQQAVRKLGLRVLLTR